MSQAAHISSHRDILNLASQTVRPNPNSVDLMEARAERGACVGFFAAGLARRSATSSGRRGVSLTTTLLPVGQGGLPPFAAPTTRLPVKSRVPTPLATPSRLHTHGDNGLCWQTSFHSLAAPETSSLQVE